MRQSDTNFLTIRSLGLVLLCTVTITKGCNNHGAWNFGHFGGGQVDYSHLDHLDASRHPTLSEKIRTVVSSHYGWGWSPSAKSVHGHGGGGVSYSHTAGGGGHHGHHVTHHNGWSGGSSTDDDGNYEYAAHNHQNNVVVLGPGPAPEVKVPAPASTTQDRANIRKPKIIMRKINKHQIKENDNTAKQEMNRENRVIKNILSAKGIHKVPSTSLSIDEIVTLARLKYFEKMAQHKNNS